MALKAEPDVICFIASTVAAAPDPSARAQRRRRTLTVTEKDELLTRTFGDAALDRVDDEGGVRGAVLADAGGVDDVDGLAVRHGGECGADHACAVSAIWSRQRTAKTSRRSLRCQLIRRRNT